MRTKTYIHSAILAVIGGALLTGCATSGAQLCRKDPLLHPEVRFDERGNRIAIDDHVYFSKEGTPGGRGVSGGGCGCN